MKVMFMLLHTFSELIIVNVMFKICISTVEGFYSVVSKTCGTFANIVTAAKVPITEALTVIECQ